MKLRKLLAAAVGSVGATALANYVLASRAEDFEPFLDGDQGSYRWRGFDVSYTEYGDPDDQDVLLLHGTSVAASSHEYWRVVDELADDHHVVVPDLPGYGHSDRPPLLYSGSLYTTFVGDAIDELCDEPLVVASSLTSSYAAQAATDHDTAGLVLVCPTDSGMGDQRVWVRALLRSPIVGKGLFNLMASKPSLSYFNEDHGYADMENLPDAVVDYEWYTAHQSGARFAPASFLSGFLSPEETLDATLAEVDEPVTFVWGRDVDVTPLSEGRDLAETVDAGLVVFDHAKLLPHTEHPEEFADVVRGDVDDAV